MESDKQLSLLNYLPLPELKLGSGQHVDSGNQTFIGTPVRYVYVNTIPCNRTETAQSKKDENEKQKEITLTNLRVDSEQHLDSGNQTFVGTPFVYISTTPSAKTETPPSEEDCDGEEKQKGRTRHPDTWRQNLRKKNKNHGLEYVRANGEVSAEKEMGPPCKCRMKCYLRIGEEACQKVFTNFWKLGDHSLQNAYIGGCVRIFLPKQYAKSKNEEKPSRRFYTRCFYVNVNGIDTEICKQAFLNMHSISNGRLDRLLKKKQEVGNTGIDLRGRHNNKVNKVSSDKIREVRRSIDGFRKRAGYTGKRKTKSVEILYGPLNIRTMYRVYRDEVVAKGLEPVCEFRYRKIFHTDFHIDFARPVLSPQTTASTPAPVKSLQPQLQPQPAQPPEPARPAKTTDTQDTATTFFVDEKPIYTTLEAKDSATFTISQDLYGGYTMHAQNWIFPTQT